MDPSYGSATGSRISKSPTIHSVYIIAFYGREYYAFAIGKCTFEKWAHIYLIPKRVVEHYDIGITILVVSLDLLCCRQ